MNEELNELLSKCTPENRHAEVDFGSPESKSAGKLDAIIKDIAKSHDLSSEKWDDDFELRQKEIRQLFDLVRKSPQDLMTQMYEKQAELDERIIDERSIEKDLSEWVAGITIAMESEIDEIRREVNWKWWKNPKEVDIEALRGEVIDMWHFLLSLSRVVGLTPETIYSKYMEKNAENHDRQSGKTTKEGYEIE